MTEQEIIQQIKDGKVGVLPTDTIYGVVASVFSAEAIERIYQIKKRPAFKPFVILISDFKQLADLSVNLTDEEVAEVKKVWPGPNSIILPSSSPEYLHRGSNTLALRLPDNKAIQELVSKTGPIIATSANPSGTEPHQDMTWIKQNLPGLDFYQEGKTTTAPSQLWKLEKGRLIRIAR